MIDVGSGKWVQVSGFSLLLIVVMIAGMVGISSAYDEVPVANGGSVSGRVVFTGIVPPPVKLPINKNPEVCGKEPRMLQEVRVKGGALSNVVVYVSDIKSGKPFVPPESGFKIIQEHCRFLPHIQVMKQKSKLDIYSKDSAGHNVHSFEVGKNFVRTMFNQAQPNTTIVITEKIRLRRSKVMKVECDIHSFMHAWVIVLDHPYYAVVDEDGAFKIDGIPPGKYKITAWNPALGTLEQEVTVNAHANSELNIGFK